MNRDFAVARRRMVAEQIEAAGITDPQVLRAMREVPRHRFVPRALQHRAYDACALPIGHGQTISQPFIVGLMTALLQLRGRERVLEIGTGSGYQAAVLARVAAQVVTVERIVPLARRAATILGELGEGRVVVEAADGRLGAPDHAPFEAIIVTASAPAPPLDLTVQLADGGFLLVPVVQPDGAQCLYRYHRVGDRLEVEESVGCRFVPLCEGIAD